MSKLNRLNPNFKPAFDGPQKALEIILKLKDRRAILAAYLFGSAAKGKNTENSDLDLLVVIEDKDDQKDFFKIVQEPFFANIAIDWIFKNESEFNIEKNKGGVCFIATTEGIKIY